jgi:hypothetical protein
VAGPTGATGPAGPTGGTGLTGATGPAGASGIHLVCTATTTSLPAISLGGTSYLALNATCPNSATFDTTDNVLIQALADLPGGLNLAYWRPSATNTVRVALTAGIALTLTSTTVNWRIVVDH